MKQTIYILICTLFLYSCNNNEIDKLNQQLQKLKEVNNKLTDSINTLNLDDIKQTVIVPYPLENDLELNKPFSIHYLLQLYKYYPEHNVYRIKKDGNNESKELIIEKNTNPYFIYEFTPETEEDTQIDLQIVFNVDGKSIEMTRKDKIGLKK